MRLNEKAIQHSPCIVVLPQERIVKTMRLFRFLCLAFLLGIPLVSQGQDSPKSTADAIKELFSGKSAPLSYKLKELTPDWSSMRVGQASNMQDYTQMLSSMFSGGGVYYTRGEILKVGDIKYLVAYAPPTNKVDMAAMMNPRPDPAMFKPAKLTPDTVLTLALINASSLTSLSEIRPFDLQEEVRRNNDEATQTPKADETTTRPTSVSNLKQLSLALLMYTQDYDEVLPPVKSPEKFRPLLQPYVKNESLFFVPNTEPKQAYLSNVSLSYHTQGEINNPAETVLFYEPQVATDGTRAIAFADGHVKRKPEAEFQLLLKASQMKMLNAKTEPPQKPKPKPKKRPTGKRGRSAPPRG